MGAVEVVEGGVVEADRLADETLHAVAVHSGELELLVATEPLTERARVGDVRRVRHLIDDEAKCRMADENVESDPISDERRRHLRGDIGQLREQRLHQSHELIAPERCRAVTLRPSRLRAAVGVNRDRVWRALAVMRCGRRRRARVVARVAAGGRRRACEAVQSTMALASTVT